MAVPHPVPYQGSKRQLAKAILAVAAGRASRPFDRLFEPFAGSAALTLAAAQGEHAPRFVLGDSLLPLADLWRRVRDDPQTLADDYARLWSGQQDGDETYFARVRDDYNRDTDGARLLYLLARSVKNSPRWNQQGRFNQAPDRRRIGMHPHKMRRALWGAHTLLRGRTDVRAGDFEATTADAGPRDLVYLDPPWQGTSAGPDSRYHQGLARERLIATLETLTRRRVPWLLSYDGRCGDKTYGAPLPASLGATRLHLPAGRSAQATLNGTSALTVESLYVSPALAPP